MGKVSGSYESVVRGVSEQVPHARRSGQHFAQVNMVSDPVRGNARRHGSIMQDEVLLPGVDFAKYAGVVGDTANHRVRTFYVQGNEYDFISRHKPAFGDTGRESFAWCFDKENRQFLPVVLDDDPLIDTLVAGGVSALANVGRYVYIAGNTIEPEHTRTDQWQTAANRGKMVVWVRGGAYSREFSVTLTRPDKSGVTASYKTLGAAYPELLDTSDIPVGDGYQKAVNDRRNLYDSKVTEWIGLAAADIVPANIAAKLAAELTTAGVAGVEVRDSTIVITDPSFEEVRAEDEGDGSLIRAVGNQVDNIDLVSVWHWAGKVVKAVPRDTSENAVYLKAFAKDEVSDGWTEVIWREAAGVIQQPTSVFAFATIHNGSMYISGSAAGLAAQTGLEVPGFKASSVGDELGSPLPELFTRRIDYLGVFQDRLVIGSGSTLLFSRPGDYLNWFRASVVTIKQNDPWEGYALGAEDDTIYHSTTFDRNLFLYGKRFQYMVSGRQQFTPQTANIMVATAYEDAVEAAPQNSGNFVFYAKHSGKGAKVKASLHQVQAGVIADNPESFPASGQLDTYLQGIPVEIVTLTDPNMILLRTGLSRSRVYTYSYMDVNGQGRVHDSWSHWEWDKDLVGNLAGVSRHDGDILMYMVKGGYNASGVWRAYVACEQFVRDSTLSDYPYLDSLRPLPYFQGGSGWLAANPGTDAKLSAVIDPAHELGWIGDAVTKLDDFVEQYPGEQDDTWVGVNYDASFTPTNPYPKDRNDNAILTGRLTLGRIQISLADSGAMRVTVAQYGRVSTALNYIGRTLGLPSNQVGRQGITSVNLGAVIGGEIQECKYTIHAQKWLPLTVTGIEWVGQFFFAVRRA